MKSLTYRLCQTLLFAATALAFIACAGGSGSSGFDISGASEPAAIQKALDEGQCVQRKGLTICPASEGAVAAPGTPTSSPTPPNPADTPQIDTNLDHATSLNCVLQASDTVCNLTVELRPRGFSPAAQFFIAVRNNEMNAAWAIRLQEARQGTSGFLEAPIDVPVQGLEIQVAVLVFNTPVSSLPAQVTELADSGAEFAYVTYVLMLSPGG